MRIDEIDLIGLVKVSGATSGSGQVISYTETGLKWATASSVASTSTIKKSGYNYIIVETVNTGDEYADAITNGDRLYAAYAQAKLEIIGTLSVTNRFTIILMPGSYDLYNNSYLDLDTSFIDIVGLSSNPASVYLYQSSTNEVFNYHQDVDSRLENIRISGSLLINSGATGQYLRWKNLIFANEPFSLWVDINGEFENIKCIGGFGSDILNSINGIFKNIESTGSSFTMANAGTPTLTGTFSNILINQVLGSAFYNLQGNITGYFEDISISLDPAGTGNQVVFTANDINGTFKNVKVTNNEPINTFFSTNAGSIFGTYKNIEVLSSSAVSVFKTGGFTMSGIFEDIYLPTSTYAFETTQDIFGTFSNITVGDVTTGGFMYAPTQVSGNFSDIKVGSVTSYVFYGGIVEGKFKNIEIGTSNASTFNATNTTLSGIFENIKINNVVGGVELFLSAVNLIGEYSNIEIYNIDSNIGLFTSSTGDINIKLKNFRFTNLPGIQCNVFYSPTGNIFGTYEDLYLGDLSAIFNAGLIVNINLKNLYIGYIGSFISCNGIYGTYENINLGTTTHGSVFVSSTGDINISLDEFYSQAVIGGSFFEILVSGSILGSYKNIRTSNLDGESFKATTGINAIFENIYIGAGNNSYDIWTSAGADFYGTFSNVEIGANFGAVFRAQGYNFYVNMKNVKIGPASIAFFYGGAVHQSSYLENFYTSNAIASSFDGEMVNSEIDLFTRFGDGTSLTVGSGSNIRNCKILGSQSGYGILIPIGSAQITHTLLYAGISGSNVSPNYNITGYRY